MILMRNRCSEKRKDAIAGRLHDEAAVTMDRVDHQLECWIDNRSGIFRVEILHKLHRALDVCEQRRNGLALPFRYVVEFSDYCGELGRAGGKGPRAGCLNCRARLKSGTAFLAEFCCRR